jgi:hypothetical protein
MSREDKKVAEKARQRAVQVQRLVLQVRDGLGPHDALALGQVRGRGRGRNLRAA